MESKQYVAGFNTGRTWDSPWVPGGPFVHRCDSRCKHKGCTLEKQSRQDNDDYLRGWYDGMTEQHGSEESRDKAMRMWG